LASLAVARLMFLEHTVQFFVTETDFNWGIVWRYTCVWSENHLYQVHFESGALFDRQLLAASVDRWAEERMTTIAKDTVKILYLEDAQKMQTGGGGLAVAAQLGGGGVAAAEAVVAASLAASGRVPQGPPQQQQRAQPAGRCPLCGDAGHTYKQGAYDHPAEREITQRCPQVLSNGKACGLVHAFAGPLGTLCREGL
jgi:hypothetical protein